MIPPARGLGAWLILAGEPVGAKFAFPHGELVQGLPRRPERLPRARGSRPDRTAET